MKVETKKDSIEKIKNLGLNYFEEEVIGVNDIDKIKEFFESHPAEEYCLRDPEKASGKFFFVKNFEECKKKLKYYKNFVTVCVSSNEFKDNIVLLGDIKITKSSDTVDFTARTDREATHRNIYEKPEYNFHTNLSDDKLWNVPGFSKLMAYISDHALFDVVIEFAVYDCPVGKNKEKVVVFELRSEY